MLCLDGVVEVETIAVDTREEGLLTDLLREVSRSFYLTLWVLPAAVRTPISLAYLLARATDTVADAAGVPVEARLETLESLGNWIRGGAVKRPDFLRFLSSDAGITEAEGRLLSRLSSAVQLLELCDAFEQERIRQVLDVIVSGQVLDLRRFGTVEPGTVRALATAAELDDYTYRVAGCVGEFWTRLCRNAVFPGAELDDAKLLEDGVRFGKGLQLVNILRDLPRDLQAGRCYLPDSELSEVGLEPRDLLQPACSEALRPVYRRWLDLAESHLESGWRYTTSVPRSCVRVRLACAWPVLIGIRTTGLLRGGPVLEPGHRIKLDRAAVRGILWSSVWRLPFRGLWESQFTGQRRALRVQMP
jgi:farnesyl-diphosphate farnesyltransferase